MVKVDSELLSFYADCNVINNNDAVKCPIKQYTVLRGKVATVSFNDNGACNMFIDGRNIHDLVTIRQMCLACAHNHRTR